MIGARWYASILLVFAARWMVGLPSVGADETSSDRLITFEGKQWRTSGAERVEVEKHAGQELLFVEGSNRTFTYLPDVAFQNGAIEVDFACQPRTVPGVAFHLRAQGDRRDEVLFNRWPASDQQMRIHVEQAVVTRRDGTATILNVRMPRQSSPSVDLPEGFVWFHVKLQIDGGQLRVFLNGSEQADFEVGSMFDEDASGAVGVCGGGFYFANFRYVTRP